MAGPTAGATADPPPASVYTWLSGPDPGYGFGISPTRNLSLDEHRDNIRDFSQRHRPHNRLPERRLKLRPDILNWNDRADRGMCGGLGTSCEPVRQKEVASLVGRTTLTTAGMTLLALSAVACIPGHQTQGPSREEPGMTVHVLRAVKVLDALSPARSSQSWRRAGTCTWCAFVRRQASSPISSRPFESLTRQTDTQPCTTTGTTFST